MRCSDLKLKSFFQRTHILLAIVIFQFLMLIAYSPLGTIFNKKFIGIDFIRIYDNLNDSVSLNGKTFCGYFIRHPWDGGLGSQMFVYASFYGMINRLNKKANKEAFIRVNSTPSSLDSYFENLIVPQKMILDNWTQGKSWTKLPENSCCSYTSNDLETIQCDGRNYNVTGFRVSYRYFAHVEFEIKGQFLFKEEIREKSQLFINDTMANHNLDPNRCTIVGTHLRRGDFLSPDSANYGHWPAQLDYFQRAVHFYESWFFNITSNYSYPVVKAKRKGDNCLVFLIFGNDYGWNLYATKNLDLLRPNHTHTIVTDFKKSNPGMDMCALSICDHNIISTGTFGWWSAFLGEGIVTYQEQYAKADSDHFYDYDAKAYFKPEWIAL